ncbi:malectin domain-containing carbohydrate-binding protein [Telluribacter sp. SYSU D00476]|uniref:malectin domain-containing carbohydrate-binding protein n=1 Tax=Telluribacter sp. SYSU D00476 TaxID=2811430 RepID=UPI001FF548D0|nr:malectin domain-containing carbohydrate-binding protein [Telluribacter sp. SYSU D00476]
MNKNFYSICLLLVLLSVLPQVARAQACGCTTTITASGIYDGSQMDVKPGDVVCIQAGTYSRFRFINFQGTAEQPITIKNCGGAVNIAHATYFGALDIWESRHIKLTGAGDSATPYGIVISGTGSGASGLVVGAKTTDIEIDHVEISGTGFAGMLIKTDPACDPTTWRQNFTMNNVVVRDNYVHNTGAEGIYIGHTSYQGVSLTCNGTTVTALPHLIYGLKIYNNIVKETGADGIQYACAPDAEVYNNQVETYGTDPFAAHQNMGIQIGAGAGGLCYNNKVLNGTGNGILVTDYVGGLKVYNNLIVSPGGYGIFTDDRTVPAQGSGLTIANNTIVTPGSETIRMYGSRTTKALYNNLLVAPQNGLYVVHGNGATSTESTNIKVAQVSEANFVNSAAGNYNLLVSSPAVNTGTDVSAWGIVSDLQGRVRPLGGAFEIGAYESEQNPPVLTTIEDISLLKTETLQVALTATDADGDALTFGAQSLPAFVTLAQQSATSAELSINPQGQTGTFQFTITVSDGTGGTSSQVVNLYVLDTPASPQLLFRVNAGGAELINSELNWSTDTQTSPSPYTNVAAAASTPGTMAVTTNTTGAPTELFQTMRRDSRGGGNMVWEFPVAAASGWYRVNLYFVESVSSVTRVFNILMEGSTVASNFQIREEAGLRNALKKTFEVQVADGKLTVLFERINEDPLVCGIEIYGLSTAPSGARVGVTEPDIATLKGKAGTAGATSLTLYPNPAIDEVFVDLVETDEEGIERSSTGQASYYLLDNSGKVVRQVAGAQGARSVNLDNLASGTYILKVVTPEKVYIRKVVKQ